jgi:Sulfotransferase family
VGTPYRAPFPSTPAARIFRPALSPSSLLELGPGVVGATGGSGTRVVARILRLAGLFIGTDLNESEDAWKLGAYSDRWINQYLARRPALPQELEQAMLDDLALVLGEHCSPLEAEPKPWGWKEPRSIFLLPFLHGHLPALRFLHLIRDGRDLAFSANQNQLRKHGDAAPIPTDVPDTLRSIALWSWLNVEAARYGEASLGARYLRVRFEDLCARPVEATESILEFFELDGDPAVALEEVAVPDSLGRWRTQEPAVVTELERVAGPALAELGYEPSS